MLGDKLDRRRLWVLVIACVATALVILSINLPTVILPEIAGNLSASFAEQQWLVNAYALSLAALLLTSGSQAKWASCRMNSLPPSSMG